MTLKCFVPGCTNTYGQIQMHRFPKDKALFRKWICNIGRSDMVSQQEYILKNKRICNIHFGSECNYPFKVNNSVLKKGSVPTLFLPNDASETLRDIDLPVSAEMNIETQPPSLHIVKEEECKSSVTNENTGDIDLPVSAEMNIETQASFSNIVKEEECDIDLPVLAEMNIETHSSSLNFLKKEECKSSITKETIGDIVLTVSADMNIETQSSSLNILKGEECGEASAGTSSNYTDLKIRDHIASEHCYPKPNDIRIQYEISANNIAVPYSKVLGNESQLLKNFIKDIKGKKYIICKKVTLSATEKQKDGQKGLYKNKISW